MPLQLSIDEKTRERELKSLVKASGIYNVKTLTLITYKEDFQITQDGLKIQVHPIWKWLLN
ncbi:MAG TPA: hypothetical protein PLJ21_08490 [Pseudobdellovibrionaceae bacterium]|nr:hypothetical protein [Pseudobdellovibrionaceae bacterium]